MKIIYTKTDEAPALATASLFPIIKAFLSLARIPIDIKDMSLAGRILACFPKSHPTQLQEDALCQLAHLVQEPTANIIKLPNISASVPQLKTAICELQKKGFDVPDFPENPTTDLEHQVHSIYKKVLGSSVNPVLREGNSDRRIAKPIKQYAKAHPHRNGNWSPEAPTHIASMNKGDFYESERAKVMRENTEVAIELKDQQGKSHTLKSPFSVLKDEIIDAAVMQEDALCQFFKEAMADARQKDLWLSLHLKATMMKISDPIIFSKAIEVYFQKALKQHSPKLKEIGVDLRHGLGDLFEKLKSCPIQIQEEITEAFEDCYRAGPHLAMVDSTKGITHLHCPNDVIIDSSLPALMRSSGKIWGADGQLHFTKALIPDRSYAGIYQQVIDFCKKQGAFDPKTMGSVSNVGLMAKKAQEYGSHDKTFCIFASGKVQVKDSLGQILLEHDVKKGDIWRMCQTKDQAIKDWVKLAITRARATGNPAVFWLDPRRGHDQILQRKVKTYLQEHNTEGLDIRFLSPVDAMSLTLQRVKDGQDTIAVTGNVLRDYLTDLFPILEVGTSAKMLSIVPLLAGGGLYETGAGGTAPRHVEQFLKENHLRWSSLGEFLALAVSLEDFSAKTNNPHIKATSKIWAEALNQANERFLKEGKSPLRQVYELDTRGSHFYWAMYWMQALAKELIKKSSLENQSLKDGSNYWKDLRDKVQALADQFKTSEAQILQELSTVQGKAVDIQGYYHPDKDLVAKAMRPSSTFNALIDQISSVNESKFFDLSLTSGLI